MAGLNENTDKSIHYGGDFRLKELNIISYRTGSVKEQALRVNILPQTMAFTIVEDITNHCITGEIDVIDGQDIRSTLPLTGMERLELNVFTPGQREIRYLEGESDLFYIYKIESIVRAGSSGKNQVYRLHFTSREAYKNSTTRVSTAFSGPVENGVWEILKDKKYLDSRKAVFLEDTDTNTKLVIPNLKPFAGIRMLGNLAKSKYYENSGYFLYESFNGFHFRSLESLYGNQVYPRPVVEKYNVNLRKRDGGERNIVADRQTVESYMFVTPVNMLEDINNGLLSNRLITNDIYTKTIKTYDYNYHDDFGNHYHTDGAGDNLWLHPFTNFDGEDKALSEYPNSKLMNLTQTSKVHNTHEFISKRDTLQQKTSQRAQMSSFHLIMTVMGQTNISVGDMIEFNLPFQRSNDKPELNPYYSGRYVILSVKHDFDIAKQRHTMTMRCMKDSVRTPLPQEIDSPVIKPTNTSNDVTTVAMQDELFDIDF